jgi:hypothetical protein
MRQLSAWVIADQASQSRNNRASVITELDRRLSEQGKNVEMRARGARTGKSAACGSGRDRHAGTVIRVRRIDP